MSKNLYVSATEERSGKSAVVLGVMQMLTRELHNVAIFRPIINDPGEGKMDHDIALMIDHFKLSIPYEDTYAFTLKRTRELINSGQHALVLESILNKYKMLEEKYDFVLCEGTDFKGKDPAFEFDLNADIAANIGAPMLVVTSGREKAPEEVVNITQTTLDTLAEKGVDSLACVVNRAPDGMTDELVGHIERKGGQELMPVYVIPEDEA
ncbi:MAG TPA: AAA family ATPase, partial [Pseudodesulfovibrio sp.]|nr:AAA family ATPase [Pseudodesulfovibrio sp.]